MTAVAALGYQMGRTADDDARADRRRAQGPWRALDGSAQEPVADMLALDAARAARRLELAARPRRTGVFDPLSGPDLVDLPRNEAPMPAYERFQSAPAPGPPPSLTGVWQHKREVGPMFSPAQSAGAVTFSGGTGNFPFRPRDPVVSGRMDNSSPTQKVNVGPAVGYGPDVPAADGFHPLFRAMPNNVGVYRKNTLPGRVIPGKSAIDLPTAPCYVYDNFAPPKFWDMKRRPLAKGMARVTAPAERPTQDLGVCSGDNDEFYDEEYFGNRYLVNGVDQSGNSAADTDATRTQNERTVRSGTSAIAPGTAVPGPMAGAADTHLDEGRFEKLHSYEADRLGGPPESLVAVGAGTVGAVAPQPTLRQITTARPYGHFLGIAGPTGQLVQPAEMNQSAEKQLDRHAKRGDQLVEGWVPIGKFKTPDQLTFGFAGIKGHEIGGRLMGVPAILGATTLGVATNTIGYSRAAIMNPALVGRIQAAKAKASRVSPDNPRIGDLDLAAKQLATNFANHRIGFETASAVEDRDVLPGYHTPAPGGS